MSWLMRLEISFTLEVRLLEAIQLDKPKKINIPNIKLLFDWRKIISMTLPIKKLIPMEDNAINNPPQNNILLFSLKLWIKKLLVFFI